MLAHFPEGFFASPEPCKSRWCRLRNTQVVMAGGPGFWSCGHYQHSGNGDAKIVEGGPLAINDPAIAKSVERLQGIAGAGMGGGCTL